MLILLLRRAKRREFLLAVVEVETLGPAGDLSRRNELIFVEGIMDFVLKLLVLAFC
jgi:hypothetical protein